MASKRPYLNPNFVWALEFGFGSLRLPPSQAFVTLVTCALEVYFAGRPADPCAFSKHS